MSPLERLCMLIAIHIRAPYLSELTKETGNVAGQIADLKNTIQIQKANIASLERKIIELENGRRS